MYFTEKQLRIMEFIQQFQAERGISPTLEEIAEFFGVTKITSYEHINQLERKGALKREKFRARSIELLVPVEDRGSRFSIPLMGKLRAGSPVEAPEERENFDLAILMPMSKKYFMLLVADDSLKAAGINKGDYMMVEKRSKPNDGETVVAVLENGAVMIRVYLNDDGGRLISLNSSSSRKLGAINILGIVVFTLRSFNIGKTALVKEQ